MFATVFSAAVLLAGNGIVVAPAHPTATQAVTVSFTAPVGVRDASRWYEVSVTAPSRSATCEYYEDATTTAAAKGARARLTLRPYDKRRWCTGRYVGALVLERRVPCDDRIDESTCSEDVRRLGSVSFDVGP